jgi:acyl carrier protein
VKRFFRSLFSGGSGDQPAAPAEGREPDIAQAREPVADRVRPASRFTQDEILKDLVDHICSTMPDPRAPEEIDTQLHMYDAGYLTSITAADLIAHIDARYGLDISETKLVGRLQNLAALASYIESPAD